MANKINAEAIENAKQLILDGKYRINTVWKNAQPSETEVENFAKRAGWDEVSKWFLVVDEDKKLPADSHFAVGDFKSVHRSGLQSIKRKAEKDQQPEVVDAATELIDLIDHFNAC